MNLVHKIPPGPGSGLLLRARRARMDPIGVLEGLFRQYGDLVGVRAGGRVAFLVNDPHLIQSVLVENAASFVRGIVSPTTYRLMGGSVFVSGGSSHEEKRAAMQGFFQHEFLADYVSLAAERTAQLADSWRQGAVVDVGGAMLDLTLRLSAESLFSIRSDAEVREMGAALLGASGGWARTLNPLAPVLERLPTPLNRRIQSSTRQLFRMVDRLVDERLASPGTHGDILDHVIHASSQARNGSTYTRLDLRGEAIDMLIGSSGTVAYALAWTLYELAFHPTEQTRVASAVSGVGKGGRVNATDAPALKATRAAFREGMRLHPPAWCVLRRAVVPVDVGGYTLPTDGIILMCSHITQRDPRFFHDPLRYSPGRWDGGSIQPPGGIAYYPFGVGPYNCLGEGLGTELGTVVLAQLLRSWAFDTAGCPPPELRLVALQSPGHIPVRVRALEAA